MVGKELYKMTKEELIATCKRLQSENEKLQDELERLSACYFEMENSYVNAVNTLENTDLIRVGDFKWRLQIDGMLTPQLESFIEDYLKFYNKRGEM